MLLPTSNSPRFRYTLDSELLGPHVCATDPVGWDQVGLSLHRDPKTHGLTTQYSVQLGFVKDARAYLQRAYDAARIEAAVYVLIEQLDPNSFRFERYYRGRVNFVGAVFGRLDVKVNVENEDFTQQFLNRETAVVDLLGSTSVGGRVLAAPVPQALTLHSRAIVLRFDGAVPGPLPLRTLPGTVSDNASRSQTFYFGYSTIASNEIGLQQITGGCVSGDAYSAVPIFTAPDTGTYEVELGGELDIAIANTGDPDASFGAVDIKFHYRLNGDPSTATVLALSGPTFPLGGRRLTLLPLQRTHELVPGDRLYLYGEIYVHDITDPGLTNYQFQVTVTELPGTYLRIRATTKTDPTPCVGLLAYEVFDRLASALTEQPMALRSTYFGRPDCREPQPNDGPGALAFVTSGFQLRGFPLRSALRPPGDAPDPRKSLFASWREAYDAFDAVHALGIGQETDARTGQPLLRVEHFSYFYPATVVLDFTLPGPGGRPAPALAVTTKPAADRHFQRLEFGYAAWQAEQVNGLQEANSKRQWTTPLTQVNATYSKVSAYATSGLLLEVARRQRYADSDTTDNRQDNNNFIISLLRRPDGSFETERNQRFEQLSGVLDPGSIYNARLTPARNLRRHGALVRAGLEPAGTRLVRFAFGEGNNSLVSRLLGETDEIAEAADVLVSALPAPLWWAENDAVAGAPVSRAQVQALLALPHGRVRYYDEARRVREGWILDFKHNPREQTGDFTLLPCVDLSA